MKKVFTELEGAKIQSITVDKFGRDTLTIMLNENRVLTIQGEDMKYFIAPRGIVEHREICRA